MAAAVPPGERSFAALGLLRGVAEGALVLQRCAECGTVPYPPREACPSCLGDRLPWTRVADGGRLLARTVIRASTEDFFRARGPWCAGLVRADCGPSLMVHLPPGLRTEGAVRVEARVDPGGRPVLVATAAHPGGSDALPDFVLPAAGARVRVTDTGSELGRSVATALRRRGVDVIDVGEFDAVLDTRC